MVSLLICSIKSKLANTNTTTIDLAIYKVAVIIMAYSTDRREMENAWRCVLGLSHITQKKIASNVNVIIDSSDSSRQHG